jgi:hypothetical protein
MSKNDVSRIVTDDSRAMLQIVASLTDDSVGIIYNCNMFIVQATALMGGHFSRRMMIESDGHFLSSVYTCDQTV